MASIVDMIDAFGKVLHLLRNVGQEAAEKKASRLAAIAKVEAAVLATKAFGRRERDAVEAEPMEQSLSREWAEAAAAIDNYNHDLAEIGRLKALGWADPREWHKPGVDLDKLDLDLILRECKWLREH